MDKKKIEIEHQNLIWGLGYWPWLSEYTVIKNACVDGCSILASLSIQEIVFYSKVSQNVVNNLYHLFWGL